ncbi:MAG: YceI family protein [Sulfuricellaceae bacterium]|nr:YceI family protein [Sulfuricellaceae bacterium]
MNAITKKTGVCLGMITVLFACSAQAAEFTQLQTDKSAVSFVYKQMNVPIDGRFKRFHGQISFDPAKPALARAEIDIELASIDAGSDEANDEVAGKLWFNTRAFPIARFVSTSIKPLGGNRFEVVGKMSIKGKTLDAKTPATFRQEGHSGVFAGSFVLRRADYGIGEGMWADFGTVANEVQIKFQLVASTAPRNK